METLNEEERDASNGNAIKIHKRGRGTTSIALVQAAVQ